MQTLTRLDTRFRAPAPPQRLAALRILVGLFATGYLIVRAPHLVELARLDEARFDPVGPLAGLTAPLPHALFRLLLLAGVATGVAFVAGWRFRVVGPLFAVLLLVLTTYRNSWGKVLHTENLFVLHTIVLGLAASAEAWSLDARRRERAPGPERRFGWPVWIVSLVTVATYLVAGLAKLELSGWDWVSGEQLRNQVAFDNLRKDLFGEPASPLAPFLLRHAWLFTPAGVTSLAVELGAPLALLGGWWRRVWVGSAWLFHLAILALMAILFPYQLSGIAFASLYRVERLPDRLRALAGRPARAPPGVGPAVARDSS